MDKRKDAMKVVYFGEELCERAPEYMGIFLRDPEATWATLYDIVAAMRMGEEIHIRPASGAEMQRAESAVILHDIGRQLGYAVMNLLDQEDPKVGITAVTQLREAMESAPLDEAAAIPNCLLDKQKE